MAVRSQFNNRLAPLARFGFPNDQFIGQAEATTDANALNVAIYTDQLTFLYVEQSPDKGNWYIHEQHSIQPNQQYNIQVPCVLGWFRVTITNQGGANQTYMNMITSLIQAYAPSDNVISGTVAVSNFPAVQDVSGTVAVSNLPAQQLVTGENSNFVFYPTVSNNTSAIYADGTQGVNGTAGGWQYSNINNSGKINWYCYVSPSSATDYKVSQLNSMYAVVNNLSTLGLATAQNPFIIVYTRPDGVPNLSPTPNWYKNKLFFGSNAHTDILGLKLLYTGADPVDIHPEITGINRIQLLFNSALSNNKLLADVQNDSIMFGTLQTTNNTSPANSFSFTMTEFGADWVKAPAILPIEHGAVQVGGAVGLTPALNTATYNQAVASVSFAGTAYDMGENTLVDIVIYATGTIASGSVRLDYSIDGTTWFAGIPTFALSVGDPHYVITGLKTASRFIRVSTGLSSPFRATNLQMIYSSKRA